MTRQRSLKLLRIALVGFMFVGLTAGPGKAAFPPGADRIRNWQPEFMASSHTYSRAQAVAQAKEFDVIVAGLNLYRNYLPEMRAANPDLVLLAYMNGGYSTNDNGKDHPKSWYAHDKNGRQVRSRNFGNYLMIPSNPNWIDFQQRKCQSSIATSRYDGCFLDSLGPAALQPGYATGIPVNPSTGSAWTRSAWTNATSNLARRVKSRVGPKLVVPNGIGLGRDYFAASGPTSVLSQGVDGAMVELFIRKGSAPIGEFRSVTDWKKDVDMLVNAGSNGRVLLCVTKAWVNGSTAQENALHEYALGSFLLGSNGKSYFSFLYDKVTSRPSSYWDADLGPASGSYSYSGGVYRRTFSKGLVLVNPGTATVTVPLSRSFRRLGGQVVSSSIRLGPHTASVLVHT